MKKIGLLLILICGMIGMVSAVRVTDLYQGTVPVSSQTQQERDQVLQQAFAQVLVKISGNKLTLENPSVKSHLNSASSLVQEFSYTPLHQPNEPKPYLLHLNFDVDGVNAILQEAGVPIWGEHRPLILAWLEYETPGHPAAILSGDSAQVIPALLKQDANRRGVPLMFPAMDIQDIGQVTINDITSMNIAKLTNAATRYGSDAILIGHIVQDPNQINTQWKLVMGQDQWGWNVTGKLLPDVLIALTDHMADALAARYATVVTQNVQTKIALKVTNITHEDDFPRVMNYLKHQAAVADVSVVQVVDDAVILNVNVRGNQASFTQSILSDHKLTPQPAENHMLVYQWNPN